MDSTSLNPLNGVRHHCIISTNELGKIHSKTTNQLAKPLTVGGNNLGKLGGPQVKCIKYSPQSEAKIPWKSKTYLNHIVI